MEKVKIADLTVTVGTLQILPINTSGAVMPFHREMLLQVLAPLLFWGKEVRVRTPLGVEILRISLPPGVQLEDARHNAEQLRQFYHDHLGSPLFDLQVDWNKAQQGPDQRTPREMAMGDRAKDSQGRMYGLEKPGTEDVGDGVVMEVGEAVEVHIPDRKPAA